jgi:uncharacterized membrane protein/uncharacterized lipoprotein YbaY
VNRSSLFLLLVLILLTGCSESPQKRFRCIGTEPFWSIVVTDTAILYASPEKREVWRAAKAEATGNAYVFRTYDTSENVIEITIRPGRCNDGMSDTIYEYTVTVDRGGRIVKGCAREIAALPGSPDAGEVSPGVPRTEATAAMEVESLRTRSSSLPMVTGEWLLGNTTSQYAARMDKGDPVCVVERMNVPEYGSMTATYFYSGGIPLAVEERVVRKARSSRGTSSGQDIKRIILFDNNGASLRSDKTVNGSSTKIEEEEIASAWEHAKALAVSVKRKAAQSAANPTAVVKGRVMYLQRIALSPDAVVRVTLKALHEGGYGMTIGEQRIETFGKIPVSFAIPYEPSGINPAGSYGIIAQIIVGNTVIFENTKPQPARIGGGPSVVDVVVEPAR